VFPLLPPTHTYNRLSCFFIVHVIFHCSRSSRFDGFPNSSYTRSSSHLSCCVSSSSSTRSLLLTSHKPPPKPVDPRRQHHPCHLMLVLYAIRSTHEFHPTTPFVFRSLSILCPCSLTYFLVSRTLSSFGSSFGSSIFHFYLSGPLCNVRFCFVFRNVLSFLFIHKLVYSSRPHPFFSQKARYSPPVDVITDSDHRSRTCRRPFPAFFSSLVALCIGILCTVVYRR